MKILATLDLNELYMKHNVPVICHDHPTQPDNFNACVKAIEAALQSVDWASVGDDQLLSLDLTKNIVNASGDVTIAVNVLENPVSLGTLLLRESEGAFQFSTDGGSSWDEVGSGDGVSDHTLLTNIGSYSHFDIDTHIDNEAIHFCPALLRGDGLSHLASTSGLTSYRLDQDVITLVGVITPSVLTAAESFLKLVDAQYGNIVLDFGKNSTNQLYLTQGNPGTGSSETLTSLTVFDSDMLNLPIEVGVMIDRTTHQVTFFWGGNVEAAQTGTQDHLHDHSWTQTLTLGDAFAGDVHWFGACRTLLYPASSCHTPMRGRFSQGRGWLLLYDCTEGSGVTLHDQYGLLHGNPADLTVSGAWVLSPWLD